MKLTIKKLNEMLEESLLGDLAKLGISSYRDSKSEEQRANKSKEDKLTKKVEVAYLKDFIEDFIADYKKAMTDGRIRKISKKKHGYGITDERFTKMKPALERDIKTRNIKTKSQLGSWIAKKHPELWKNTPDKNKILSALMPNETTNESTYFELFDLLLEAELTKTDTTESKEAISEWVVRWFTAYMKGIRWDGIQDKVKQLAKEIEANSKDTQKTREYIEQLAALSWDMVVTHKKIPWGAQDVFYASDSERLATQHIASENDRLLAAIYKMDPNIIKKAKAKVGRK